MVKVVGWPGYEEFEGEEIGRLSGLDGTVFVIVLDENKSVYPVPVEYVEER